MTPIDWGAYLNQILVVVVPALALLIVTAIGYGTLLFKRKMEASTAVDKDALLKSKAKQGVYLAEEASAQQKEATGKAMTGEQKGKVATDFLVSAIPDTSLTQAPLAVQAQVGATKGVGASKELGEVLVVAPDLCKFPVIGQTEVKR